MSIRQTLEQGSQNFWPHETTRLGIGCDNLETEQGSQIFWPHETRRSGVGYDNLEDCIETNRRIVKGQQKDFVICLQNSATALRTHTRDHRFPQDIEVYECELHLIAL